MARDRLLKKQMRQRFHVTLTTGETFDGLLDEWDGNYLILLDAGQLIAASNTETVRVKVDGQLFLPREHIAYLQRAGL